MFELSVACKYLIPRWRQLSVSIISLVSTLVIALVVWLIVVFFSVKDGLENSWIDKIVALTAPIRITPTEKYYSSYYYLADSISANSNYTSKSIGEKHVASSSDPYDPSTDEELPIHWTKPDLDAQGSVKDLVKLAFASSSKLSGLKNLQVTEYETTMANLRLRLLRHGLGTDHPSQQFLEHAAYVGTFDAGTPALSSALIPPTTADVQNLLHLQSVSINNIQEDSPDSINHLTPEETQTRLKAFFDAIEITALKVPSQGWRLPIKLLPENAHLISAAVLKDNRIIRIIIPMKADHLSKLLEELNSGGLSASAADLKIENKKIEVRLADGAFKPLSGRTPVTLEGSTVLPVGLDPSFSNIKNIQEVQFSVNAPLQGYFLKGKLPLGRLEIAQINMRNAPNNTLFAHSSNQGLLLPKDPSVGEAILLPKVFKETGALIGDHGYLSYYSPTPSTVQEQRIPVFIAGFYDPGIMPIGGKYILAGKELTALIRASYNQDESLISNGINVRFDNLSEAPRTKADLIQAFNKAGIAPYWHIETYQEFEFTKDLIQQLHSEKNLFSLISLIIIIVACSNIISMLIILVNDKKLEIGILRSMGATSGSIAAIFGICGMVMGAAGSFIGTVAAVFTLRYVNELVGFISSLQGHDLFNPVFYGHTLPSEVSMEALSFVIMTTAAISLLAGIVPALKASMLRPSAILRAE